MTFDVEREEMRQRIADLVQCEHQKCQLEAESISIKKELEYLRTKIQEKEADVEAAAADATAWHAKEAELLSYTQQLTDKLVAVQSEAMATANKAQLLEAEHQPLAQRNKQLETRLAETQKELETEKTARQQEMQLLSRKARKFLVKFTHRVALPQHFVYDNSEEKMYRYRYLKITKI
jgi:chromosome segregation ATPase